MSLQSSVKTCLAPLAAAHYDFSPMRDNVESAKTKTDRRWRSLIDWHLVVLLAAAAAIHFLTLPAFFYLGDNFACRAETANLLTTGRLGIDYSQRPLLGDLVQQRGKYIFENDEAQKFFSRYGIGYTFLYVPPLLAQKLYAGHVGLTERSRSQIFFLGVYQILFAMATVAYLYSILGLYTRRKWTRVIFVLVTVYCTFLWHYLRAPTTEIFQILFFVGFYYHLAVFLRSQSPPTEEETVASPQWKHLLFSTLYAGILLTLKPFYAVLPLVGCLFVLLAGPVRQKIVDRAAGNLKRNFIRYFLFVGLPTAAFAVLILWSNKFRFGEWLNPGYFQWIEADGLSHDRFSLGSLPGAVRGFFLNPGNANVFIHFPVFALALAGVPRFARKYPFELALIGGIFFANLIPLCMFYSWGGEWCYGPRYLLNILILGSIPFLEVMDWLATLSRRAIRAILVAFMTVVFCWSLEMQIYVNSLDYFVYYQVSGLLKNLKQERIDEYLEQTTRFHRGYLCRDILAYRNRGEEFYPFKVLKEVVPPEKKAIIPKIENMVDTLTRPNYFFADQ